MSRTPVAKMVLAMATLATVALLTWHAAREPDAVSHEGAPPARTADGTDAPPIAASGHRRATTAAAGAADTADDAPPAPAPEPFGISVRVLRADGSPAAGAVVTTVVGARAAMEPTEKTADAEGRAAFDDLELSGSTALHARWDDCEAAVVLRPEEPGELQVRLEPATAVEGRVETTHGAPVAGAECELLWSEESGISWPASLTRTESDAEGRFQFPTLPRAPRGVVESVRAWTSDRRWDGDEHPVQDGGVVLRVRSGRMAVGRCVDVSGRPVPFVRVFADGTGSVRTGDDGRFALPDIPLGAWHLAFEPPEHAPCLVAFDEGRDDVDARDVVLRAGLPVSGIVVTSDGRPVPGADVAAVRWSENHGRILWSRRVRTGPDGRFALDHLATDCDVEVQCDWSHDTVGLLTTVRPPARDLRFELPSEGLLRLRFLESDGVTPVAVDSVEVVCPRWRYRSTCPLPSAEVVLRAEPGPVTGVTVLAKGWREVTLPEITLRRDAPVTVEVRLVERDVPDRPPEPGAR